MQNNQEKLLSVLRRRKDAVLLDDLASDSGLTVPDTISALTMLEINNAVRRNPDGRYVLPASSAPAKRATKTRQAVKKPAGKRLEGNIIKVRICSSRYRDSGSGRFVPTPTNITKVEILRKRRALGQEKWLDGTARARYTLEDKNGRTVPKVRYFSDSEARAALKKSTSAEEKKAIRKFNTDARRELQKELRREYDADFLDKELRADVRRSIAVRSVRTRAENKAAGKKPKNAPSVAVAQAAVLKLELQLPDLNARFNRARTEKPRRQAATRRNNTVKFLEHWRLVVSGKRKTYPKGWRK